MPPPEFTPAPTLVSLPDDVWLALSPHLHPITLFNLLHVTHSLRHRLLPLLPHLLRNLSPAVRHTALLSSLTSLNQPLVKFLLLAPGLPRLPAPAQPFSFLVAHPLLAAKLPAALAYFLAGEYLRCVGSVDAVLDIAAVHTDPLALAAISLSSLGSAAASRRLAQRLVLAGRGVLAVRLLACDVRAAYGAAQLDGCARCEGGHHLLHAAAHVGDTVVVQGVVKLLGEDVVQALMMRDCRGDTPLGVAIRKRKSRVAQMLVRCGSQVRDLVGCASRGGGALEAGEIWFKPVVDVD